MLSRSQPGQDIGEQEATSLDSEEAVERST